MFDSGISAKDLIAQLKSEVDAAEEIPNATYITFLNALEQMLYADFIKEQNTIKVSLSPAVNVFPATVDLSGLEIPDTEDNVTFEDIYAVYVNHNLQLIKTSPANGIIFPNSYYKTGVNLSYSSKNPVREIRIVYIVKPAVKTVDENDVIQDGNVMIPLEFIELVKSKLRYEAYMLVNEYTAAANWVNVFNSLLTTFSEWLANREPQFG